MLVQASAPPAAVAPAPPQALRLATVAQHVRPFFLTKAGRTESGTVRHQIFLKTTVTAGPVAMVAGQSTVARPCMWKIEAYLQREICFQSMTGLSSCTDALSKQLAIGEAGQADLAVEQVCDVTAKPVEQAESRTVASVDRAAAQMFEDDYRLTVRPMLATAGVTITGSSSKTATR